MEVRIGEELPKGRLASEISSRLRYRAASNIVVVCVGTDRSTGDSLGPMVGTFLAEAKIQCPVYGTLADTINASNLQTFIDDMLHGSEYVIVVDACLGRTTSVGEVLVRDGPLVPGSGVGKKLPAIGDLVVQGVVGVHSGALSYMELMSVRLWIVYKLARYIAEEVTCAIHNSQFQQAGDIARVRGSL